MDFFNLLFGFFTGSADQTSTSFRSFRRFFSIERIVAAAVDYFGTSQVKWGVLNLKIPKFLWQKLPILCATKIFRNLNEEKKIMLYIVILGLIVVPSHFRNVFHVKTVFFSVLNLKK